MYYQKPKNLKYTDMCIYIDAHAYDENKSTEVKETIYKYIYFLSHMLAIKMHLFNDYKYYDDFAIWYTTQLFFRIENTKTDKSKIKSILNYIKSTIALRKISFEQQEYSQVLTKETDEPCVDHGYSLSDKINENLDLLYTAEFDLSILNCNLFIKKFLNRIPYKKSSTIYQNIYLSCLLSFINSITLSNKDLKRIKNLKFQNNIDYLKLYSRENDSPVILYHLDQQFHDYILVLLRQLKHEFALELSRRSHTYLGTHDGLYSLTVSELNGTVLNTEDKN